MRPYKGGAAGGQGKRLEKKKRDLPCYCWSHGCTGRRICRYVAATSLASAGVTYPISHFLDALNGRVFLSHYDAWMALTGGHGAMPATAAIQDRPQPSAAPDCFLSIFHFIRQASWRDRRQP